MSFFGFGQTADIDIVFDNADRRKVVDVRTSADGKKEKHLLFYDGETVSGRVNVTVRRPATKIEHQGIKVELIGQIELFSDKSNQIEFLSLVKDLARPGDLLQHISYAFQFANVEKPYEVYSGANVRLRYFIRATVVRRLTDIVREVDIAVHTLCSYPDVTNSIKMEVGIEDCLHIEFEYNKMKYHLKDVIVGKIYFLLVRIKIKTMEISIIKKETTVSSPNTFVENETVAKYEIMDGAPVRGESIPIRVFLTGYDLTPTMRDINNKFSVRYYLNLVLLDMEDRRYFKQQEIILWRRSDRARTSSPDNPQHLVESSRKRFPLTKPQNSSTLKQMEQHEVKNAEENTQNTLKNEEIPASLTHQDSGSISTEPKDDSSTIASKKEEEDECQESERRKTTVSSQDDSIEQ